ncbi:MAG: hypothetical protein RR636_09860 [Clostridium sp.]
MEKFTNWVLIYLVVVMPFLFMLYFVIKKAVKDGMDDNERYNKK